MRCIALQSAGALHAVSHISVDHALVALRHGGEERSEFLQAREMHSGRSSTLQPIDIGHASLFKEPQHDCRTIVFASRAMPSSSTGSIHH